MQVDYKLIGAKIKERRRVKGYTQERLAKKLDVSVGYISQVERGITRISLDLLASISTVLECDMAGLVTGLAMNGEAYMRDEIGELYSQLNQRERQLTLGFMELLIKSR
jgi:transcriptional regulator with XRE-family HTH domain